MNAEHRRGSLAWWLVAAITVLLPHPLFAQEAGHLSEDAVQASKAAASMSDGPDPPLEQPVQASDPEPAAEVPLHPIDDPFFLMSLEDLASVDLRTASKREEGAKEAPASVVVITRDEIALYGYVTLQEVLEHVPGFYLIDDYEDIDIGIRGTIGGAVLFMVNGVPRHPSRIKGLTVPERERLNIPVQAIDRIEIVRGPMSVVYGNNALMGVVNIVTDDAGGPEARGRLGVGNNGGAMASWRLAEPFGDDGQLVFNGGLVQSDGIGGDYVDMMGEGQLASVSPDMHQQLDGDLEHDDKAFDLSASWGGWRANLRYSQMRYGMFALTPSFRAGNDLDLTTMHGALEYQLELIPELELQALAVYSEETYDLDLDMITPDQDGFQHQFSRRFEGEATFTIRPGEATEILLGINIQTIRDAAGQASIPGIALELDEFSSAFTRTDGFAEVLHRLLPNMSLSAGVRLSQHNPVRFEQNLSIAGQGGPHTVEYYPGGDLSWVPRAALVYQLADAHTFKLLYGQAQQSTPEESFDEPERIESAELDYVLALNNVLVQASIFTHATSHLLRKLQSVDPQTGAYIRSIDNSGELRSVGGELMAQATFLDALRVGFSVTLQHTDDLKNTEIAPGNSPALMGKARVAYTTPVGRSGHLSAAVLGRYISEMKADWQWADTPGGYIRIGDDVGPFFVLSADLSYRDTSFPVWPSLHVTNLLDERVRVPANELATFQKGPFAERMRLMLLLNAEL